MYVQSLNQKNAILLTHRVILLVLKLRFSIFQVVLHLKSYILT